MHKREKTRMSETQITDVRNILLSVIYKKHHVCSIYTYVYYHDDAIEVISRYFTLHKYFPFKSFNVNL